MLSDVGEPGLMVGLTDVLIRVTHLDECCQYAAGKGEVEVRWALFPLIAL